ncbi:MAG: tetratricopeptide repeat protein [Pseudomonadota bacterium]
MSETDSFIEEVTEEVRRERLFRLIRRYGWIAALAIVLLVGGAAFNEYRKAQARAQAEAYGDALLAALETDGAGGRVTALEAIARPEDASSAVLDLLTAAQMMAAEDPAGAGDILAALATNPDVAPVYRDLAGLKRVILLGDGLDASTRAATLGALSQPGAPFRTLAQEQQALIFVEDGDPAAAIEIYETLINDAESPRDLIQRARQMIVVLGGELDAS